MSVNGKGAPIYGRQDHPDPYIRLLVRVRVRKGIGQGVIARRMGVHPSTVARWESGKMLMPLCRQEDYAEIVGVQARREVEAAE